MKKTPSRGKAGPAGSSPFSGTIFSQKTHVLILVNAVELTYGTKGL